MCTIFEACLGCIVQVVEWALPIFGLGLTLKFAMPKGPQLVSFSSHAASNWDEWKLVAI